MLINNAGTKGGERQALDDLDLAAWHEAFDVNTIGPLLIARAFKPHLLAAGDARLMTVSSQLGASTWPLGGSYVYATSKAAVNKTMQALAIDWRDAPIIVAMIHPGWVRTDMGGDQAPLSPEESAAGIARLVEDLEMAQSGRFWNWDGSERAW